MTIITVTEDYQIRKIPLNYSIEKWSPSTEILSGASKGKMSIAKWRPVESFHGNLKNALLAIRNKLIEDELANYDEVIMEEMISIIEKVDESLLTRLQNIIDENNTKD